MPQMNKGGKFIFGKSLIRTDGTLRIPPQAINKCNNDRDKLNRERGGLEKERERADTERQNLTLLDEKNRKTQMYLTYARKIYEELENVYRTSEEEIRNRLQDTINDIFKQIYEGGLSLTIDSKYHITVQANDYEGDVETSTAQSISVIFDVCTRVWGIGIPIKRLTRRYAVAIKWRYGNTWVDLALIYEPSYIYKRWRGKIQGVREKNFRKIKITQKLDF